MAAASRSLDDWRRVFSCANSDIFELIEKALLVAAEDRPKEFMDRRASIAEKLFSSQNSGWNHGGLQVPDIGEHEGDLEEMEGRGFERELGEKDTINSNCDSGHLSRAGLTVVIEEDRQLDGEVMKIKEVLCKKQKESEAVLYEPLMRLQRMQLSIETLKETQIGRAVNGLRKHNSKQIRTLVRTLIDGWKLVVDKWIDATTSIANDVTLEPSHDFVNPSVMDDEVVLPSPLMNGAAQLDIQTTTTHFSEFSDGIDVDENYKDSVNLNKITDTLQVTPESCKLMRHQESLKKVKVQGITNKPIKHYTTDSGPCRPLKLASEQNPIIHVHRKPLSTIQENLKDYGGALNMVKLEITKRKLRDGYQQAEEAKKQRTIKIIELHDLPKEPKATPKKKSRKRINIRQ